MNNLIITCGTSQLDEAKLLRLGITHAEYNGYYVDELQKQDEMPGADYLRDQRLTQEAERLWTRLEKRWDSRGRMLTRPENQFGAEIATLTLMEQEGGDSIWQPASDRVVVLASATHDGMFAAKVLELALRRGWGMPDQSVIVDVVPKLCERPVSAYASSEQLAIKLTQRLQPGAHNILVMSGGFKSVIPCLTIFSLLFGAKLVYLFEKSDQLQVLDARFNTDDPDARKFWQKTWEGMARQGWVAEQANPYLRVALNYRIEKADAIF